MATEIIFATHALSQDNLDGIATGWLRGRLSSEGRRLAAELGEHLRGQRPDAVFVSDLARAVETATIAFGESGIPISRDARLRECNYGELNGASTALLAAERARRIDQPFPGGQSYREVVAQVRDFLRELAARWDGGRVVVIAHSASRWAFDCLLNGARLEDLVNAPFNWRESWSYGLPTGWTGDSSATDDQATTHASAGQP